MDTAKQIKTTEQALANLNEHIKKSCSSVGILTERIKELRQRLSFEQSYIDRK